MPMLQLHCSFLSEGRSMFVWFCWLLYLARLLSKLEGKSLPSLEFLFLNIRITAVHPTYHFQDLGVQLQSICFKWKFFSCTTTTHIPFQLRYRMLCHPQHFCLLEMQKIPIEKTKGEENKFTKVFIYFYFQTTSARKG